MATSWMLMRGLREHSVVLMGKNTLMKRCIKLYVERTKEEKWTVLLDYLVGNVGIIFTNVSVCSFPLQEVYHTLHHNALTSL